jgi:glycerophosphoryl diester phosphodiesterase
MFVGEKRPGAVDPLVRNGLASGRVYVFSGDDAAHNTEATFSGKGTSISGHWAEVDWRANPTSASFDAASRVAGSFLFVRVEDGAADPRQPGVFYFVTTGAPGTVNPFGRLYQLDFDPDNPTGPARLTLLLDGSEGIVSPDNIDVNKHGEIAIQEDPNYNLATLGLARDSSVFIYRTTSKTLTRVAEIDRAAARGHALAADPANTSVASTDVPGGWESSGVVDAERLLGRGAWLLDVQAHSLRIAPASETVEGGQVLLMVWIPEDDGGAY